MNINYKAFSLIELMVVITIVAIITAVAIPSYKDYVNRAKVTSMLSVVDPCLHQVYQYFFRNDQLPDGSTAGQVISCYNTNLPSSTPAAPNLNDKVSCSFTISPTNTFFQFNLTHTDLHPTGSTSLYQIYVRLTSNNGDLEYVCGTFNSNTMPNNLMPNSCTGPRIQ